MKRQKSIQPFDDATKALPVHIRQVLQRLPEDVKDNISEIRMRSNRFLVLCGTNRTLFVSKKGTLCTEQSDELLTLNHNDIVNTFHSICNYSVYSHQNEIKNGFITMNGGHRVGIAGVAVVNDGSISSIRDISALNIRIAREIIGSANELMFKLNRHLSGLLIAGPPSCGKTTLLRDIARQLSYKMKVCILDERGEIAAMCGGVAQNDIGLSDVLTGYPKGAGILQAVRCLSPQLIICDELGSTEECYALTQGLNAGVSVIASVHCGSMDELRRRVQLKELLATQAFSKVVLMSGASAPGAISGIYKIGDNVV